MDFSRLAEWDMLPLLDFEIDFTMLAEALALWLLDALCDCEKNGRRLREPDCERD